MSMWTHITACLSVETGMLMKRPKLKSYVQEYLKKAPKITGSEEDATVYVNIQNGYNCYLSRDCKHCKYQDELIDVKGVDDKQDYCICNHASRKNCERNYQTCIVISIQGDLRDKTPEETKEEFEAFKKYVSTFGYIRDYAINIEGE